MAWEFLTRRIAKRVGDKFPGELKLCILDAAAEQDKPFRHPFITYGLRRDL